VLGFGNGGNVGCCCRIFLPGVTDPRANRSIEVDSLAIPALAPAYATKDSTTTITTAQADPQPEAGAG